jgi:hypothetical protein
MHQVVINNYIVFLCILFTKCSLCGDISMRKCWKLYVCGLYVCVEDVFYLLGVHCAGISCA